MGILCGNGAHHSIGTVEGKQSGGEIITLIKIIWQNLQDIGHMKDAKKLH
jgi:hypothetical protein